MSNDISLPDIQDRQLLSTDPTPKGNVWTDIGQAEITHTLFGRAKVRIIHKQDKMHRVLMLTVLLLTAIAVVVWQGWVSFPQNESLQGADSLPVPSNSFQESAQASQPVYTNLHTTPPSVEIKPGMPSQLTIYKPMVNHNNVPQQPVGSKAVEPLTSQPYMTNNPQAIQNATSNSSSANPKDIQEPANPSLPNQPIAKTSSATRSSLPAASSPAAVEAPSAPKVQDVTLKQIPDSVNAQSK